MTDKVQTDAPPEDKDPAGEAESEATSGRSGCLSAVLPSTTPGCAAWLMAVFLICTIATVWIVFWLDPNNVPWRYTLSWWRITAVIGLALCIPVVVYKTTELWLKGVPGIHPDLDYAWRAGLHALEANELSIDSVPIYLITGSSSETQEKALMNATGLSFSIEGVPLGPAPIHWYANSEAIYIFCSDCSWASALASLREEMSAEAATSEAVDAPFPTRIMDYAAIANPMPTAMEPAPAFPPPAAPFAPAPAAAPMNYRGTVMLNAEGTEATAVPTSSRPSPASPALRGTLILGDGSTNEVQPSLLAPAPAFPSPATRQAPAWPSSSTSSKGNDAESRRKPVLVSHHYASACLQELQYLGQLVRNARQPLCPINGILSLIQFEAIHSTAAELEELQKALRADMETIQYAFQLRAPVTALVVGLEKERGFRELVLRVGPERALNQRFGRRFDVHAIPTKSELQALTVHVCGVFEDWAYSLFREEQSLMRPGNTRLYALLAKVRCEWKTRLNDLLTGGFGCEPGKGNEVTSNLFSGCYFAATGETPDRQAFVKGVIDKLGEEQELIEWTADARRANQRQNIAANLGMIVTVALLVCLIFMYLFL